MTPEEREKILKIIAFLDELGIPYDEPLIHPRTITCEESLNHYEQAGYSLENYSLCRNIFIRDKRGRYFFLLVLDYDTEVDLDEIRSKMLLPRLVSATSEDLNKFLSTEKGNVSIFNLINDDANKVRVIIDKKVLEKQAMAFHPNSNCATLFLTKEAVFSFLDSIGHKPVVTDISLYGEQLKKNLPEVINYWQKNFLWYYSC